MDYLEEAVTDTVFSRGGEVLLQERQLKSGLHEVGAPAPPWSAGPAGALAPLERWRCWSAAPA